MYGMQLLRHLQIDFFFFCWNGTPVYSLVHPFQQNMCTVQFKFKETILPLSVVKSGDESGVIQFHRISINRL